ncbi:hypothetical protein THAOC_20978, partial [Thalassiosira oceanica]
MTVRSTMKTMKIASGAMDESRKRAKTGNDGDEVARTPSVVARKSPKSTDAAVAAAAKTAELQEELEALKQSHKVVVGELNSKLGTLNAKVEELEAKVDALQAENESKKCEIKDLTAALQWAYGAEEIPQQHWLERGRDEEYADAMEHLLDGIKQSIKDLRMGTVSENEFGENTIKFDFDLQDEDGSFIRADHDELLVPYWKELAAALRHWSEYHADGKCLEVQILYIELPKSVLDILRPAYNESRIEKVYFVNSHHTGDMADFAKKVLQANHLITEVGFGDIKFTREDVKTICDAIKSRNSVGQSIKGPVMTKCFDNGIDTHTLKMFLTSITIGSAKEVALGLDFNGMSSREAVIIAEFLNSNPSLAGLNLDDNRFDDADAAVLAGSLSNNTQLANIWIGRNSEIKENGRLAFLRAVFDVSSLSSCAASNHACRVLGLERDISVLNRHESASVNKWSKIFAMLALSSEDSFINTALLRGVPAQLIPMILDKCNDVGCTDDDHELTDLYLEVTGATRCHKHDIWDSLGETKSLNCIRDGEIPQRSNARRPGAEVERLNKSTSLPAPRVLVPGPWGKNPLDRGVELTRDPPAVLGLSNPNLPSAPPAPPPDPEVTASLELEVDATDMERTPRRRRSPCLLCNAPCRRSASRTETRRVPPRSSSDGGDPKRPRRVDVGARPKACTSAYTPAAAATHATHASADVFGGADDDHLMFTVPHVHVHYVPVGVLRFPPAFREFLAWGPWARGAWARSPPPKAARARPEPDQSQTKMDDNTNSSNSAPREGGGGSRPGPPPSGGVNDDGSNSGGPGNSGPRRESSLGRQLQGAASGKEREMPSIHGEGGMTDPSTPRRSIIKGGDGPPASSSQSENLFVNCCDEVMTTIAQYALPPEVYSLCLTSKRFFERKSDKLLSSRLLHTSLTTSLERVLRTGMAGLSCDQLKSFSEMAASLPPGSVVISGSSLVQAALGEKWDHTDVDIYCTAGAAPAVRSWLVRDARKMVLNAGDQNYPSAAVNRESGTFVTTIHHVEGYGNVPEEGADMSASGGQQPVPFYYDEA